MMKHFRSMAAILLAMILALSVPMAGAESIAEPVSGVTAELKIDTQELKVSATLCADPAQSVFSLVGSYDSANKPMNLELYRNAEAIVLRSNLLPDQYYGVDLTAAAENLPGSIFAPNSGSRYALSEEKMAALERALVSFSPALAAVTATKSTEGGESAPMLTEAESEVLAKYIALAQELDGVEVAMKSEKVKIGSEEIPTSAVKVTLGNEALLGVLNDVLGEAVKDEAVKDLLLARIAEKDQAEALWAKLPELLQKAAEYVEKNGIACSVSVNTNKEDKSLVALTAELTVRGDPLNISLQKGSSEILLDVTASGEKMLSADYAILENTDEAYAAVLNVTEGETESMNVNLAWDKVSGEYTCTVTAEGETTEYAGTMKVEDDRIAITVDTENGKKLGDVSLTITKGCTVTVPAFTEVLTMDEAAFSSAISGATLALFTLMI